jgi:hypothetical protein
LDSRSPHATGLPSASGTVMRGAFATRASAADRASVERGQPHCARQKKNPRSEDRNREEELMPVLRFKAEDVRRVARIITLRMTRDSIVHDRAPDRTRRKL